MRCCLMIEGQESVSWSDWTEIAAAAESSGFDGLFTSDHYGSVQGQPNRASFDAWTVLGAIAVRTSRIRLGTLVSPATFRHPSVLAKAVTTVDHVSGGRAELGLGAGWLPTEHASYGFAFPELGARMEMLGEQLEIVHRQWSEQSFSFAGKHWTLDSCEALPKPVQQPHPPLMVGGLAGPRSAALAAKWADEYNIVSTAFADIPARVAVLREACTAAGRDPGTLRLSVMAGAVLGRDQGEFDERMRRTEQWLGRDGLAGLVAGRWFAGTTGEVVAIIKDLESMGIGRVMLQTLLHDDVEQMRLIGAEIIPAV